MMAVRNSCSALFWDHNWALKKPLSNMVTFSHSHTGEIPQEIQGAIVSEMWEVPSGW